MIQVGDNVGGYQILSKLTQGGMATLYLATRGGASGFSKHVAVKVVHEHLAQDPTFVEMFVDEALLSSRIHHPNVVHIEELRQLDGQHFLVMEYVSGVALNQLVRRLSRLGRRMTPELAVYIAVQVADGLHAAHELKDANGQLEGLVHRDVSPQNVLVAWEGYVKLIDFGVAKARSRFQQTTSASLKGKVRYMAPEQARGLDVDRRTDIYALGIVLWEMLTMRPRFQGDNDFALLDQVRTPEHIPVRNYNPAVSPGLDAVLKKALAPEMRDRFPSAQELRRALAIAVPTALTLDASHLSELVRTACADELSEARQQLPHSLVLPGSVETGGYMQAAPLQTLTVSASQVLVFAEELSGSLARPSSGPTASTVSHSSLLYPNASPPRPPPSRPSPPPPPPSRPSPPRPPPARPSPPRPPPARPSPPPPPPSRPSPPQPPPARPSLPQPPPAQPVLSPAALSQPPSPLAPPIAEPLREEAFTLPPKGPAKRAASPKLMGIVLFLLFVGVSVYILFPPSTNTVRAPTTVERFGARPDAGSADGGDTDAGDAAPDHATKGARRGRRRPGLR